MKTITDTTYKNLTMPQRFRAAVSAYGRDDMQEVKRLEDTCGEGEYTIPKLSARMGDFTIMTMTITLDLMNCLANWLLAQTLENNDFASDRAYDVADRVISQSLTECASIVTARNDWLESNGICLQDYDRFNSPASPMLAELIKHSEGKQDPGLVASYLEAIESYFKGRYPS